MERAMKNNLRRSIICIILAAAMILSMAACSEKPSANTGGNNTAPAENGVPALTKSMELKYATGFSVDYYEGGYKLITVNEGPDIYLVIPENDCCNRAGKICVYLHGFISS